MRKNSLAAAIEELPREAPSQRRKQEPVGLDPSSPFAREDAVLEAPPGDGQEGLPRSGSLQPSRCRLVQASTLSVWRRAAEVVWRSCVPTCHLGAFNPKDHLS